MMFNRNVACVLIVACIGLPGNLSTAGESAFQDRITRIEPDARHARSKAVVVADAPLVHTAQLLPLDHEGKLVSGNARAQAARILENLQRVFGAAGTDLSAAVKLNVYLADDSAKAPVTGAIRQAFRAQPPAVSFVVGNLPHPGARVAMDAIAPAPGVENKPRRVSRVPGIHAHEGFELAATLPAGPKMYVSGMADTNPLPLATRKTLEKLAAALAHVGLSAAEIIQLKTFLQPMADVDEVRKEIAAFFDGHAPPTVYVEWLSAHPAPPIEIELIAAGKPDSGNTTEAVSYINPPGMAGSKVYSRIARLNGGKLIYISDLHGTGANDGAGQIREIFASLGRILETTGGNFENLVKATYYVTDNDASHQLNVIRPDFYNPQRPPAASKAKVASVGTPGKTVAIDMIAAVP